MSQPINKTFKITVPITKCYLRKADDGTEKYVVEGMASNANLDLTGERMAETAITAMAKSLETHKVYLNNEHRPDWDSDYGEVTKLWETQNHELMMEAELDPDHYRTQTLVKALEKGKQLGLSIEGYVQDWSMEFSDELKRMVKTYKDILLNKISTTGTPAVADTWLTNIAKSVDWKEPPMPKPEVEKTDVVDDAKQAAEDAKDAAEEKAEEVAEAVEDAKENAEEQSESPEPESTEKSTESNEESAQDEPTPVDETAAAQEESDATADEPADDPAPAQADDDTSEVTKAAILGSYAEADVTVAAIADLTYNLRWSIWDAIASDMSKEEKIAFVESALTEYHKIIASLATALIESGIDNAEDTAKAFTGDSPEVLSKSLTEKDSKVDELTKSLSAKDEELATVRKSLEESDNELEKLKARKSLVFDKFAGAAEEIKKSEDEAKAQEEANKLFANFVITGAK
jgi:phage head maturation protease